MSDNNTELKAGDKVLVSEIRGVREHTVIRANAAMVWTEEVPEGFRREFIVERPAKYGEERRAA